MERSGEPGGSGSFIRARATWQVPGGVTLTTVHGAVEPSNLDRATCLRHPPRGTSRACAVVRRLRWMAVQVPERAGTRGVTGASDAALGPFPAGNRDRKKRQPRWGGTTAGRRDRPTPSRPRSICLAGQIAIWKRPRQEVGAVARPRTPVWALPVRIRGERSMPSSQAACLPASVLLESTPGRLRGALTQPEVLLPLRVPWSMRQVGRP